MSVVTPKWIGVDSWLPYGESVLTVVEKVGMLNHRTPTETARLLGAYGHRTFVAKKRQNPRDRKILQLAAFARQCRWPSDVLDASFPSFYRPVDVLGDPPDELFFKDRGRLRLCADCVELGVHLMLHQLTEIQRCPIHRRELTEHCPSCRSSLGLYSYPPERRHSLACKHCGWDAWPTPIPPDEIFQTERCSLVAEYAGWIGRVGQMSGRLNDRLYLLDPLPRMRSIANLHAMFPGPSWISDCVEGAARVRIVRSTISARPQDAEQFIDKIGSSHLGEVTRSNFPPHIANNPPWSHKRSVIFWKVHQMDKHLEHQYNPKRYDSGARLTLFGYTIRQSEYTSVAALALHWWRRCMAPIIRLHEGLPSRFEHPSKIDDSIPWKLWTRGAGGLLVRRDHKIPMKGMGSIAQQVAKHWFDQLLHDLYLSLLGRASSLPQVPICPPDLLDSAFDTGGMPVSLLTIGEGSIEMSTATVLAPRDRFVDLFDSGYTGFDEPSACAAPYVNPVHELVGIDKDERRQFTERLLATAGRYD